MRIYFSMLARLARVATGLLMTALVLMGCILATPSEMDLLEPSDFEVEGQDARSGFEMLWGGPLPASASDFHYYSYGWQDSVAFGRFTLPAEDLEAVLGSTTTSGTICIYEFFEVGQSSIFYDEQIDKEWWTPDAATKTLGTDQCQGENGVFYNLMVDASNETTYIVYLYAFTT